FPHRGVNIVDWETPDPAVRRALLDAAIEWSGAQQLSTWSMSLPAETRGLLEATAFVPAARDGLVRQGPAGIVRALGTSAHHPEPTLGARSLLDATSWDLRMLYSMAG